MSEDEVLDMYRFASRALTLSFFLLSLSALAQENRIVRVGVLVPQNRTGRSVMLNMEQDRLVAALDRQKPDKKLHLKVQGVPLEAATAEEADAEAKKKNCDYVVSTSIIELQSATDPTMQQQQQQRPGVPGTIQTNPAGVWSTPASGRTLNPEYRATVEYRLYRTGNSSAISGAPFTNPHASSEESAVSQLMSQIANRVFAEVKKAPAAMQE